MKPSYFSLENVSYFIQYWPWKPTPWKLFYPVWAIKPTPWKLFYPVWAMKPTPWKLFYSVWAMKPTPWRLFYLVSAMKPTPWKLFYSVWAMKSTPWKLFHPHTHSWGHGNSFQPVVAPKPVFKKMFLIICFMKQKYMYLIINNWIMKDEVVGVVFREIISDVRLG